MVKSSPDTVPAETLSSDDWDEQTDYTAIRFAYAAMPDYNAYTIQIVESALADEAMVDWNAGRSPQALEKIQELVAQWPLSLEGHLRLADGAAVVLRSLKEPKVIALMTDLERHHRTVYRGIIASIQASGDGKSKQTAYKVISIPEENWLLRELRLRKMGQSLETEGGKSYDYIEAQPLDGGERRTVIFDINAFYR